MPPLGRVTRDVSIQRELHNDKKILIVLLVVALIAGTAVFLILKLNRYQVSGVVELDGISTGKVIRDEKNALHLWPKRNGCAQNAGLCHGTGQVVSNASDTPFCFRKDL